MSCIWLTTLAVILSLTALAVDSALPDIVKVFQGSVYTLKSDPKPWKDAAAACEAEGGKLAEIETAEENSFLRDLVMTSGMENPACYWLGGTDAEVEGKWKWASGRCMDSFTDWHEGQPNDDPGSGGADCLDFLKEYDFHWNDGPCSAKCNFLCEARICQYV